jgi:hypothetical protein
LQAWRSGSRSPLQNVRDEQAPDNKRIVDQVAHLVPVWDFGRPAWLSDRPDLWRDFSHYSTTIADGGSSAPRHPGRWILAG